MKFKKLELTDINAQRVYDNYIKTVETAVKQLTYDDRLDIMMEFNSHIYENLQNKTENSEMDSLLNAIDRLGTPEEVLKPLIADRMLDKATRTFNPLDVMKALFYNIANGVSYIIFAILYLFLFSFVILIGAEIINPDRVGMYHKEGEIQALGWYSGAEAQYELLGHWFIPVMILCIIVLYLLITLLLKFKKSLSKSKNMKSIITTLAILLVSQIGFSQSLEFTKLDSFFTALEENDRYYGSVAIFKDNNIMYTNAIGFADIENDIHNNDETQFRIGSISKTFTAVLIMKAVELEKINLDNTIDLYFPEIQNASKITVRHLLNHRSGINTFTDSDYQTWFTNTVTEAELMEKIIAKGISFEPDTKHEYSNSNYVLLTFILEKIFNQSFPQILEQYITKPLNLTNTSYGDVINTAENQARSYRMDTTWTIATEGDMSIPLGAGGIVSTPSDLCLFGDALFSGKLISKNSLDQMKPVGDASYGFALYDMPFAEADGIGHGGNIDAFTSTLTYFEEEDICIAMSCNGSNYGHHDVTLAVIKEIFGAHYNLPNFNFIELNSEELDQYLGTYTSDDVPIDITISKEGNQLFAKAPGQSSFRLMAEGNHTFNCMPIGFKITFNPNEKKSIIEQQGMVFEMALKQMDTNINVNDSLSQYTGTYESDELPMDLIISVEDNMLIGQGTGQSSFPLTSEGEDTFFNSDIGLKISFKPSEKSLFFKQGGMMYKMKLKEQNQNIESKNLDLDPFLGTYESDKLPMDLTISKKDNMLFGQGTGQPSFPLKSEGGSEFSNKDIGLTITFYPEEKKMTFSQGGMQLDMNKKQ